MSVPEMTVVVGLVSGAVDRVRTCLDGLAQQDVPDLEVLVPYDDPCAAVTALSSDFPDVEFVHAEGLDTEAARAGSSREHHGTLRAIGMRRAKGRIIALIEDVGRADPGWCRALLNAFERHTEAGAVGGGMACGSRRLRNRALCLADFWRYQQPVPEATSWFASDANVAYRADLLREIPGALEGSLHETVVNGRLLERGHEIWLTPAATVYQERGHLGWGEILHERFVWGRSFGGKRGESMPLSKRLLYAALTPALPPLLAWRTMRLALARGRFRSEFLPVLPLLMPLFGVWAFGEMIGYVTARVDGTSAAADEPSAAPPGGRPADQ